MTSYCIMPTDEYLTSLNIPRCSFNFDDADQLRIHLMCAMLCCPKQIDDDGCIRADLVNKNASEITGQLMDLYAIGRKATQEDVNEFTKITKNLERLFQHPMFSKIVAMDGQANFHAVPPESIRKLYDRILRGGKATRRKDGLKETMKKREANTPEAVYKSKVACNFLMELIERERLHRGLRMVEWQSVQNRYREMVINEESEDRELMDTYIEKYGMDFSMNSLNSELIKRWTGRSQAVRGFAMPLFLPIHHEMRNNVLYVGFNDDAVLYSEEELQRDKELWQSGERAKDKRFEKERNNPVEKERGNELDGVVPLRSRQAHTERTEPLLSPDPTHSSPFATGAKPNQMYPRQQWKPEPPKEKVNMHGTLEPQYVPKFASSQNDNPDSDSDSAVPSEASGVYSDEEQEEERKGKTNDPQEKKFGATNEWRSKDATSLPNPKSHAPSAAQYENAAPRQSPSMMRKPANISSMPQPRANPWEISENEIPEVVKPTARYEPPSSTMPHAPVGSESSANTFTQPPPSASTPRHRSAFEACKSFGVQEENNESKSSHGSRAPPDSGNENRTRNLYERRANTDSRQDRYDRRESGEFQQDRYDHRGNIELKRDRYEHRENAEFQHDRYDRRGNAESRQDRDGCYRNDPPFRPYQEAASGRCSRLREEQNYRSSTTDRRVEDDYRDDREPFHPQNSRSTVGNARSKTQTRGTDGGSIFSQQIDESCIRRETPRMSSRNTPNRERSPPASQRFVPDPSNRLYPDAQRTFGGAGFSRSESRDYDQREERSNRRDPDYSGYRNHNDTQESAPKTSSFTSRQDNRQQTAPSPEASVGAKNDSFKRHNRSKNHSPVPGLDPDEQACLHMIRDFAFIHRNVISSGFRPLGTVLNLFPTNHGVEYWVKRIRAHLPDVEVVPFRDTFVVVWKEGASSS